VLLGFPELDNGVTYSSAALFIAGELLRHVHRKLISPSCRAFTEGGRFRPRNALRAFNASRTAPTACDPRSAPRLLTSIRGRSVGEQRLFGEADVEVPSVSGESGVSRS